MYDDKDLLIESPADDEEDLVLETPEDPTDPLQCSLTSLAPEIQDILRHAYGADLENAPKELTPELTFADFLDLLGFLDNIKQQKVILMRCGLVSDSPMEQQEVADALDYPLNRVNYIEQKFLRKLRFLLRKRRMIHHRSKFLEQQSDN